MVIAATSINANYLTDSQVLAVQHVVIRIGLEFLFFGIHALLFIVSTWLLFRKGIGLVRARIFLLILTSVMFLASLGVIIIDMMICLRQASSYGRNAPMTRNLTFDLRLASEVLMRLNFLLGDVIVVWRTWVVWSHSLRVWLLLAVCLLGTIGTSIANATMAIIDFVRNTQGPNTLSLVLTLPPLITNSMATSLIALKVWNYWKQIKPMFQTTTTTTSGKFSTRTEQVLILLVESGFLYCAVWLLILIAGFDVMTPANNTLIRGIAVSLTGIYPTFIVIMVSLDKSHANTVFSSGDRTTEISQPLHFANSETSQSNESESPLPGENKDNRQQAGLHLTARIAYNGGEPLHWARSAKSLELERHQG
ncbi:hypothetical protein E1B28_002846 [Marasmius oreades]|uniref:Uncharacterized protein n=1 Tax=Marasmius oreades TaxID=181124 RepID=A0A9P7UME1_9AGAR|nr:uncharacterized protein E1B28_002846 [Marasmius oreades]KAG7086930.1 hypothetical protein E1B28_002846 [Marasmius oreades]